MMYIHFWNDSPAVFGKTPDILTNAEQHCAPSQKSLSLLRTMPLRSAHIRRLHFDNKLSLGWQFTIKFSLKIQFSIMTIFSACMCYFVRKSRKCIYGYFPNGQLSANIYMHIPPKEHSKITRLRPKSIRVHMWAWVNCIEGEGDGRVQKQKVYNFPPSSFIRKTTNYHISSCFQQLYWI
jgi:hypothetical protein